MATLAEEVTRRRTFAIISHPDAGKTTLTEKFLLYGGAIQLAGSVKARRAQRSATSDWMKIEQERGISVTSTVLQFDYEGYRVNLLDTPGHQDFGEDTYRTLMAADAAIMLLDGGKGVEPVTEKLYAVCKMRQIPVFTFVNKMDRPSLEPLQLHDEIRHKLGLENTPYNWPIGNGPSFCGVVDRQSREVILFERQEGGAKEALSRVASLDDPAVEARVGREGVKKIKEELAMLEEATLPLDGELVSRGELSPVFFGSAVTNFGVEQLLRAFLKLGPPPAGRDSDQGHVDPSQEQFTGFVFKTQANMDPRHRDRIAFIRVVSGKFEGGMEAYNSRMERPVRLANPKEFFGRERDTITEAYGGDILGIMNQGQLQIGDCLSAGKPLRFPGIPRFSPEHFCILRCSPSSRKSFNKGVEELLQEGLVQGLRDPDAAGNDVILGAVGPLQFEVMQHRLLNEYRAETTQDPMPYKLARWITGPDEAKESLKGTSTVRLVEDLSGNMVGLFRDPWSLENVKKNHSKLEFSPIAPVK
jgi:peptide chain release factor 3